MFYIFIILLITSCSPTVIVGGAFGLTAISIVQDVPDQKISVIQDVTKDSIVKNIDYIFLENNIKNIEYYVLNNIVFLKGNVITIEERLNISMLVWKVKGVLNIINNIDVLNKKDSYRNDEFLNMKIRATLDVISSLYSIYYTETVDGIVYLMGISKGKDDLNKTINVLKEIGGVKNVISFVILDISDYD
ncbi:MAG: hypothetical protein P857_988 [Candidatus Xenolissoclinum pacificiensis L6]|uniref:BON domain-containing protein n=1 Tax=Candidatus Xenolissoclinum pacificiensis L6 TaxID=1401685 RepID=W2V139_9RICK|nr:MAG: hypothetical protein P857_988 [Candidatus Xenolissoclinum pacificiensis L6]